MARLADNPKIGQNVKAQIEEDLGLEVNAVALYNAAVQTAHDAGDNTSRDTFESLLKTKRTMWTDWKPNST
jgi:bacterioferritin (cytochrome b1)